MRSRFSPVYSHFTTQEDSSEKCNHCSTVIRSVQASNLEKHLHSHEGPWKNYLKEKQELAEHPPEPKGSGRKRKLEKSQPLFSFNLSKPPKKELPQSEIDRLDKEAILVGANPAASLTTVKMHQNMMVKGYIVSTV